VTVLRIDARELVLPRRPFRVVANPPYSITSDLVRKLLKTPSGMVAADLVLQRAAARRFSDPARVPPRWRTEIGRTVPRKAFRPPPQVDSAVLVIRRRFRCTGRQARGFGEESWPTPASRFVGCRAGCLVFRQQPRQGVFSLCRHSSH